TFFQAGGIERLLSGAEKAVFAFLLFPVKPFYHPSQRRHCIEGGCRLFVRIKLRSEILIDLIGAEPESRQVSEGGFLLHDRQREASKDRLYELPEAQLV